MLKKLLKVIEKVFNVKIRRTFPIGFNIFSDIKFAFPNYKFETIFDVGANIGQSAKTYLSKFPTSLIYCFEPSSLTYSLLRKNLKSEKNIFLYNLAFSEEEGEMKFSMYENSLLNRLYDLNSVSVEIPLEVVKVDTIDNFCKKNNIDKISYLKIDTEGNDYRVLKSAKEMLKNYLIDFIEVETGMNITNEVHVPSEIIKKFMDDNNYYLFGIYEQTWEWNIKKPILRRTNQLYISGKQAKI